MKEIHFLKVYDYGIPQPDTEDSWGLQPWLLVQ